MPARRSSRSSVPLPAAFEQVHADLKAGPLAHLPAGNFAANSAWRVLAAIAFDLDRAADRAHEQSVLDRCFQVQLQRAPASVDASIPRLLTRGLARVRPITRTNRPVTRIAEAAPAAAPISIIGGLPMMIERSP